MGSRAPPRKVTLSECPLSLSPLGKNLEETQEANPVPVERGPNQPTDTKLPRFVEIPRAGLPNDIVPVASAVSETPWIANTAQATPTTPAILVTEDAGLIAPTVPKPPNDIIPVASAVSETPWIANTARAISTTLAVLVTKDAGLVAPTVLKPPNDIVPIASAVSETPWIANTARATPTTPAVLVIKDTNSVAPTVPKPPNDIVPGASAISETPWIANTARATLTTPAVLVTEDAGSVAPTIPKPPNDIIPVTSAVSETPWIANTAQATPTTPAVLVTEDAGSVADANSVATTVPKPPQVPSAVLIAPTVPKTSSIESTIPVAPAVDETPPTPSAVLVEPPVAKTPPIADPPKDNGCAQTVTIDEGDHKSGRVSLWERVMVYVEQSDSDAGIIAFVQDQAKKLAQDRDDQLAMQQTQQRNTDDEPTNLHQDVESIRQGIRDMIEPPQVQGDQHTWKGKFASTLHEYVDRLVKTLTSFAASVDVAVSRDPGNAALPWAAVRCVLSLVAARDELRSRFADGLKEVTRLLMRCDTCGDLYLKPDPTCRIPKGALDTLESSIVETYAQSLLFLGFVHCNGESKAYKAWFQLNDAGDWVNRLTECRRTLKQHEDICKDHRTHQISQDSSHGRQGVNEMSTKLDQYIGEGAQREKDKDQDDLLDKLYPVKRAAYKLNSGDDDNASCHPETRRDLLAEICHWARDPEGKCIYWLQGKLGTGKSTIARTVAQRFADSGILGTSFLFNRQESDRRNAARFFPTIAYRLAKQRHALTENICEAVRENSEIAEYSPRHQFEKLIMKPLEEMASSGPQKEPNPLTIVVVVDAIDECDDGRQLQTVIPLLTQASQLRTKGVSLKFFITSRPESHILRPFDNIPDAFQGRVLDEVAERVTERDMLTFVASQLAKIRKDYNSATRNRIKLPQDWPSQANVQTLVEISMPLFIVAAIFCKLIASPPEGTPEDQLNEILKNKKLDQDTPLRESYPLVLKQLLKVRPEGFLFNKKVMAKTLTLFHDVVGAIVILNYSLSLSSISQLLGIGQESIYSKLCQLESVLNVPSDPNVPITVHHQSFREFLVDPENREGNDFWVDEKETHKKLVTKCFQLLRNNYLKRDICNMQMPQKLRADIDEQTITKCLPPAVQYACLSWVYHVKESNEVLDDGHEAYGFLQRHFLHWLEALSLLGAIWQAAGLIEDLEASIHPNHSSAVSQFLHDAKRFVVDWRAVVDLAPLQVYASALVFTPDESIVGTIFRKDIDWVTQKPIIKRSWNPITQELINLDGLFAYSTGVSSVDTMHVAVWPKGHTIGIETKEGVGHEVNVPCENPSSLALNVDAKLVAIGSAENTIEIWDVEGRLQQTLNGHEKSVIKIAFSVDSKLVASVSNDRTIKIWDVVTGNLQCTLEVHGESFSSVAFSADKRLIASGSNACTVKIWDVSTGNLQYTLQGHSGGISAIGFSADNKLVASGSNDCTIKIWDVATGHLQCTFKGHSASFVMIAFINDDKTIMAMSIDDSFKFWDVTTGVVGGVVENPYAIQRIVFSPDGKIILSESKKKFEKWDAATGTLAEHPGALNHSTFSTDNSLIATEWLLNTDHIYSVSDIFMSSPVQTSQDGVWLELSEQHRLWLPPNYRAAQLAVSPSKSKIALGCPSGEVIVIGFRA